MARDDFDDLTPIPRYHGRTVFRLTLLAILALAAAAVAGYQAWILYDEAEANADELAQARACQQELTKIKQQVAALDTQVVGSESKLRQAESQASSAQANLTATQEELATLRKQRAETEARLAAFKDLGEKFKKMIDSGKIEVKIRNGMPVMTLPAEVLFPSGSASLSRQGELAVMEVGVTLKQMPKRRFMVVGHTDSQPVKGSTFKDNWELSTARAVTVTKFLVSAGLNPKMMLAAGHGEHDPVASNKNKEGRDKNRRIDILLMPDLAEMPSLPGDETAPAGGAGAAPSPGTPSGTPPGAPSGTPSGTPPSGTPSGTSPSGTPSGTPPSGTAPPSGAPPPTDTAPADGAKKDKGGG
jgi:chemotaxis protein MotB